MNPPGGISLIIHIFIVILGNIKRALIYILRKVGVADSKIMRFTRKRVTVFDNTFVERSTSFIIIATILAIICLSVFLSVGGAFEHESNITFIAGLVKFIGSVL
jgi:hypothetical protein